MTPMEFDLFCRSYLENNPNYVEPMSREQFDTLASQFPKKVDKHGRAVR